jgi:hypothetical protein
MDKILSFYLCSKDWIDLIKDIVFFFGAVTLVKYLWNKKFKDQSQNIENDLAKRKSIEDQLNKYVYEKYKNKVGIGIRFIYWKNYPNKLNNDAFPYELFIYPRESNVLPSGYINNTGISFVERLWCFSQSAYVDKNGFFFFDSKNQKIKGFKEFQNSELVRQIPFNHIVNFDFREFIEYEPLFYTKYQYNNWKLYDDRLVLRNKLDEQWLMLELSKKKMLHKNSLLWYYWLRFRL